MDGAITYSDVKAAKCKEFDMKHEKKTCVCQMCGKLITPSEYECGGGDCFDCNMNHGDWD